MHWYHGIFLPIIKVLDLCNIISLKFHPHKTLTWSLILQEWVRYMYLNYSETSFYHLLLLMVYMERKMTLIISTALIIMFTSFTKKSGRSAGWLYLSELGSLVSGMGDNQVISSTCCVKIITAQGATTKTPHQQLSDCEAWRKNRLWQQQSNKKKIRKSITNKKWKVHFMMCVGSKK